MTAVLYIIAGTVLCVLAVWLIHGRRRNAPRSQVPCTSDDDNVLRMLKALGMPDHCVEFQVTARVNDIVTATATYYPHTGRVTDEELALVTEQYEIVRRDQVEPEYGESRH